ncbi:alginate O-acetyltransferase complex protein AlgI [Conyzicola lurida]|uniref:Alginate O-acetyltransferase complex protein AlgI n=1 Tax=Conyzicola lurida TaxID=1172621 RepID=A0A841AU58_9MICO|nr:alginate O-acetyltransferase complex protein AlgI [Conyzicola lurida]
MFLPVTLLVYHLLPVHGRTRNWWLLLASVLFYWWGVGGEIVAISFVAVFSFVATWVSWYITKKRVQSGHPGAARVPLALTVAIILIPLLVFKYIPQAAESGVPGFTRLADSFGAADWILPLGISFFTFHAVSFAVDSARTGFPLTRSFPSYLMYLFVFPHQIAGPIVRYAEIKEEIENPRVITPSRLGYGASRFTWGLAKKVLIADNAGLVANAMFDSAAYSGQLSAPGAWIGAIAYAIQIYFDFSGYSDMAIGLAAMLGFHFPENFRSPYASHSISDFWRRWHITLTRWFRDYVYIPLGGNRRGAVVEYGALLVVFALTSLWHGALVGFLIWGGLQAAAMLIERATGLRDSKRFLLVRRILTAFFILFAWVPFRTTDFEHSVEIWRAMLFRYPADFVAPQILTSLTSLSIAALILGALAFFASSKRTGFERVFAPTEGNLAVSKVRGWAVAPVLFVVTIAGVLLSDFSPFLYFQF